MADQRREPMTRPTEIDPLAALRDGKADLLYDVQRRNVLNILESYHYREDVIIELIQNTMDAMEARWHKWDGNTPVTDQLENEVPTIVITLDTANDTISVLDNGIGITDEDLEEVLIPNVSRKPPGLPSRGHKGAATTFLAYGHNQFELHTKAGGSPLAYQLSGGLFWVKGVPAAPPKFIQIEATAELNNVGRGSYAKVSVTGVPDRSIKGVLHNTLQMWGHLIRTRTALGYVDLGRASKRSYWLEQLQVDLRIDGPGPGTAKVDAVFPLPHLTVATGKAEELQTLQNKPSEIRNRELIYVERNHPALMLLLGHDIRALENAANSDDRDIAEKLRTYEVSAYASLAWENTYYDDQWKQGIGKPAAERSSFSWVNGGVLAASVCMPSGVVGPHPALSVSTPQDRRRLFVLVHFNDKFRPDLGRKTFPSSLESTVAWLTKQLMRLLRTQERRLLKPVSDSTHGASSLDQASEDLKAETKNIAGLWAGEPLAKNLVLDRVPRWEPELIVQFCHLVSRGDLMGYALRGIPGNGMRYDALFDFELTDAATQTGDVVPKGVHVGRFTSGVLHRSNQWLEFKIELENLLANCAQDHGEPSKKYFEHINLAVVWHVGEGLEDFVVTPVDASNWHTRTFYGSTHFVTRAGNEHKIEVIELRTVLDLTD